mmetsp:Transcript_119631/g.338659  ORF Transcript_119631/g.338659 Transcript_119631/m.338659 type:complete len:258 (+) Transcript_119631:2148-2921(+)
MRRIICSTSSAFKTSPVARPASAGRSASVRSTAARRSSDSAWPCATKLSGPVEVATELASSDRRCSPSRASAACTAPCSSSARRSQSASKLVRRSATSWQRLSRSANRASVISLRNVFESCCVLKDCSMCNNRNSCRNTSSLSAKSASLSFAGTICWSSEGLAAADGSRRKARACSASGYEATSCVRLGPTFCRWGACSSSPSCAAVSVLLLMALLSVSSMDIVMRLAFSAQSLLMPLGAMATDGGRWPHTAEEACG